MELAGQPPGVAPAASNRGYAMAALLVGMSVMAVLMSALLPVWSHMAKREKEEELIFRGRQYARAIGLFQRKFANTAPPTIDVLVEQRFLRKKYKDPITNDDFQPIYANQGIQQPGPSSVKPGQLAAPPAPSGLKPAFGSPAGGVQGGVIGVTSKSKDESIKIYNGRTRYNEWAFIHVQTTVQPGQPGMGVPLKPGQKSGPFGNSGPNPFGGPGSGGGPGGRGGFNPMPGGMMPGGMLQNPNGSLTTPNGSTTFTPMTPGQVLPPGVGQPNRPPVTRRPGGQ